MVGSDSQVTSRAPFGFFDRGFDVFLGLNCSKVTQFFDQFWHYYAGCLKGYLFGRATCLRLQDPPPLSCGFKTTYFLHTKKVCIFPYKETNLHCKTKKNVIHRLRTLKCAPQTSWLWAVAVFLTDGNKNYRALGCGHHCSPAGRILRESDFQRCPR